MADQEIAKHTKKLLKLTASDAHSFWPKLREITQEVLIIVFAVSFSIWLHQIGEHRHEQAQVKRFLLGLRCDLQGDISQLGEIVASYRAFDANYAFLGNLDVAHLPEREKFDKAYEFMLVNSFYIPQLSRYEGFKSSGKLTNIENENLLGKILTFYQQAIPVLRYSEGGWQSRQQILRDYLDKTLDGNDSWEHRFEIVTAPKGRYFLKRMLAGKQLYQRYQFLIDGGSQIIKDIEQTYPDVDHNSVTERCSK